MLSINISELAFTVLSFLLFLFLLNKFLFKPVISFTEERKRRMDAGLAEEKAILDRMEELRLREEAESEARRQQLEQEQASLGSRRLEAHRRKLEQIRLEGETERLMMREKAVTKAGEAALELRGHQDALAQTLAARILGR